MNLICDERTHEALPVNLICGHRPVSEDRRTLCILESLVEKSVLKYLFIYTQELTSYHPNCMSPACMGCALSIIVQQQLVTFCGVSSIPFLVKRAKIAWEYGYDCFSDEVLEVYC